MTACASTVETRYHGAIRCILRAHHYGSHRAQRRNAQWAEIMFLWWDKFTSAVGMCPPGKHCRTCTCA